MGSRTPQPPRLARVLVRLRGRGAAGHDAESDLLELFAARLADRGAGYARRAYWRDALSLWLHRAAPLTSNPDGNVVGSGVSPTTSWGLDAMRHDIIFAGRLFRRQPGIVALTVAGLALAIGVATAVFSILDAAALRPLGVADPDAAVRVWRTHRNGASTSWAYSEYLRLREGARLSAPEAWVPETAPIGDTPHHPDGAASLSVHLVSGGYLTTFGARAALGRILMPEDDRPGAPLAAVVNHTFWHTRLGGDPTVLKRTIYVFDIPATIVGVTHRRFTGATDEPPAVWLPIVPAQAVWSHLGPFDAASGALVSIAARVAPAASLAQAQTELSALAVSAAPPAGPALRPSTGAGLAPADTRDGPRARVVVSVVMTAVGLILLLACANVANLLLASATTRQREIGVRLALGAGRARIVRQLLTESLMLAAVAGALGLLVVVWLLPALAALLQLPPTIDFAPDARLYGFAVLVSLAAGIGAGLAPARHGTRGSLLPALAGESAQASGHPRARLLRSSFLAAQAAASIVLLVLAALLTRAVVYVSHVDLGFDAARLLSVSPGFDRAQYDSNRTAEYWDVAMDRVKALPGVEVAALAEYAPLGTSLRTTALERDGYQFIVQHNWTSADYFRTAGIRLLRGRAYAPEEVRAGAPVAVVSVRLAREFWGTADPLGDTLERVSRALAGVRILGVVPDGVTDSLTESHTGTIYRPLSDARVANALLLVRAAGDAASLARPLRDALHAIDPMLAPRVWLVRNWYEGRLMRARALATLAGIVGVLALGLALIGIFGVTAFVVAQRMREVGVRIAIGATRRDVIWLLMFDALRPVAIGVAVGLSAALLGGTIIAGVLYGISPRDPVAIGAAVVVLLTTAALAVLLAARRAARVDPVTILRQA